jgi:predicted MFS family arabinose efflux permease
MRTATPYLVIMVGKSVVNTPSARTAVGTVAMVAMLSPLNTSIVPVALPALQREFGMSTGAATSLLTVFALTSAVAHPLAGHLADRLGARRILVAGLLVAGVSALAAAYAGTFSLLVALRALQALGISAAFPSGIALLQRLKSREGLGRPVPATWLGAVAMSSNLGAALGPILGGVLVVTVGWRAIFLANLPIIIAGTVLVLRQFPVDREYDCRVSGGSVGHDAAPRYGALFSVYARFAIACTVFFSAFFALPLWLVQSRGVGAIGTGAMMLSMVIASALITPIAIRAISRYGVAATLIVGAIGLFLGTGLLATVDAPPSLAAPFAAMAAIGASHAFNNLALQAELRDVASPEQLGTAAGLFQAARFIGAGLAAGLVGINVTSNASSEELHGLWIATLILSFALLVWAAASSKRGRVT